MMTVMNLIDDESIPTDHMKKRHRRHTIARPASALALVSDSSASEDSEDDGQFDRISDILSNLLQEANEAVNYDKKAVMPVISKLPSSPTTIEVKPKRLQRAIPTRPVSYPSSSSLNIRRRSATPISTTTLTHKSGNNGKELLESFKRLDSSMAIIDSLSRDLVPAEDLVVLSKSRPTIMVPPKNSSFAKKRHNGLRSMIMHTPFDTRLSALLLLPLLHVPHALISMVFDNMSSTNNSSQSNSSLGGMVAWAFIFAITNLVMDKAVIITTPCSSDVNNRTVVSNSVISATIDKPSGKRSLPGSFIMDRQQSKYNNSRKRPNSINSSRRPFSRRRGSKQQIYPQQQQKVMPDSSQDNATVYMQNNYSTFNLLERRSTLLRRNSL